MGIIKNVAIVGHASKGKTTLSEAMLGVAGVVERMGKIADGNTVSDNDAEEKKRGVSISSSVIQFGYKDAKINRLKKFLVAAEDVKNNKSDCIVMDAIPANELVKSNPELKVLDGILFQDKYGMAVKKGNKELLNSINLVLEELIKDGKIDEYIIKFSE